MKRLLPLLSCLFLALSGCASTAAAFVKHRSEMSSVRGEILSVRNLESGTFRRLADGIAFTVGNDGCEVRIKLGKRNEQTYSLEEGTVLVFGKSKDYILRDAANYVPPMPQAQ